MFLYFNPYIFGTTGPGPVIPSGYITQSLVGYWDYGLLSSYYGANALVIHDLSGNGLDMTYALTGSYYPPPYTSNGYGAINQTGTTPFSSSPQNGYLSNVAYTQNFTSTGFTFEYSGIPTVIYGTGGFPSFIGFLIGSTPYFLGYNAVSATNGQIGFYDNNVNKVQAGANSLQIGNEQHYTITSTSAGSLNIYINGTLSGSGTTALPSAGTGTLFIGSWNPLTGYGGQNITSMARVYNAPLSASNVWTNYGNVYQNLTYKTYTPTAPSYKTYITSGLVGYWDFTNSSSYPGTGAAVTDLSGSNIGLTISGTPSFNSTGALSYNPSATSYAASSSVALNLSSGFTMESLVYFTSLTNSPVIFSYSTSNGSNYVCQQAASSGGFNSTAGGSYTGFFSSATGVITTGQWYHLVSVFSSLTASSCVNYINGVVIANSTSLTFTAFPNNPASTQIYLGDYYAGSSLYVNGKVALGRIYNTPLTAAQVQENYVSAFSKLTGTVPYVMTGLLGYWDLADSRSSSLAGSALNDLGPNGYNLTFGTSPTYQTTGALAAITSATSSASSAITPSLNFTASGFTFECVANLYQYASLSNVISYVSGSTSIGLTFLPTAINVVGYGTWAGSTNAAGGCYSSNTFAHVCVVINSTVATAASYYINGALVATQSTGLTNFLAFPNGTASGTLIIGATPNNTVSGFNGRIAMVRVYSTALSASQVRQNYSAAFSKLASNPYVLPPPLNLNLAFPPALNFAASSSVNLTYISETAQSYGNGQYICICSSNGGGSRGASSAFGATNLWFSNTSNQNYLTTSPFTESNSTSNAAINGIYGEWVGATLPVQIIPTGFSFYTYGVYTPTQFSIFGSNVNADPYFSSVVLLMQASNGISDVSSYGATLTNQGGVSVSSVQSKFGTSSFYFNGSSNIFTPTTSTYNFGTQNFTIEMWAYPGNGLWGVAGNGGYGNGGAGNNTYWTCGIWPTGNQFIGTGSGEADYGFAQAANSWVHVAYVRNGNVISVYQNGVQNTTSTVTTTNPITTLSTNYIIIGVDGKSGNVRAGFQGYLDQIRVTIGVCRYTSNFTAPTSPFPNVGWATLGSFGPITQPNIVGTFQYYQLPSTTTSYNTLVMLVTAGNSATQVCVQGLQFYGTPVSSLAVPPGLPYWTSNAQYTTTNLIGYWDTALTQSSPGNGSITLFDLSGLGNNILFPSAPTYVTSPPSYTSTTTSYANNYLSINYSTGGFTYECLFYLSSMPATNGYLLNHWTNGYSTGSFGLGITSTGAIGIITSGTVGGNYQTGTGIITTGKWYHVVVVNNAQAIYLNGVSQIIGTNVAPSGFPGAAYQPFYIGNQYNNTSLGIQGSIAMARVYSSSLTYQQVFSNYSHCVLKAAGTYFPTSAPTPSSLGWTATSGGVSELFPSSTIPTSSPLISASAGNIPVFNATLTNTTVSSVTYGSGLYTVSASDSQVYNSGGIFYSPIAAFLVGGTSSYPSACEWVVSGSVYSSSSPYLYASTFTTFCKTNNIVYPGAWLQIQLPAGVILTSYNLTSPNNAASLGPNTWVLLGSIDGVSWILLDSQSGITWATANLQKTFTPATISTAYNYYRISIQNANQFGYTGITLWQIYAKW